MTPREPDRYEEKAREVWRYVMPEDERSVSFIAAALRQAADEALERAAQEIEWLGHPRASINAAAVRALASPVVAPAVEPSEPVAPALDANEIVYQCEHAGHPVSACTVCLPLARMATLEAAAGTMCWRCKADPHHRDLENCSASAIRALSRRAARGRRRG